MAMLISVRPDDGERWRYPGIESVIVKVPNTPGVRPGPYSSLPDYLAAYVEQVTAPLIETIPPASPPDPESETP